MSFVSFSDACRELGIDGKTLHRWLAQAQLPLLAHASDGRKHGLSQAHLQELASRHHRGLPSPVPLPSSSAGALPADLLTLPEQVAGLQSQLSALQQQVAHLQALLESSRCAPGAATPSASKASQSRQRSAEAVAGRVAAAKIPPSTPTHKPKHVIARVEYAGDDGYVVIDPKKGVLPFALESPAWFAWLGEQTSFRFVGKEGYFSAHHWWRAPGGAWRGHRQLRNHTRSLRLAPTNDLTVAVLEQAAAQFQALLK